MYVPAPVLCLVFWKLSQLFEWAIFNSTSWSSLAEIYCNFFSVLFILNCRGNKIFITFSFHARKKYFFSVNSVFMSFSVRRVFFIWVYIFVLILFIISWVPLCLLPGSDFGAFPKRLLLICTEVIGLI